jgi:hypothetical protein
VHTLKVIALGLAALGVFLVAGRLLGGAPRQAMALAARIFVPVWLVAATVNLWLGVSRAGYSVADELPVFLVVFAVPAAVALVVSWRLRGG